MSRWWKNLKLQSRLSFARDRVVECYFWIVGVYYEPSYSRGQIILTKVLAIVSILDDTYDVYGTLQECELFTSCVERYVYLISYPFLSHCFIFYGNIIGTILCNMDFLSSNHSLMLAHCDLINKHYETNK